MPRTRRYIFNTLMVSLLLLLGTVGCQSPSAREPEKSKQLPKAPQRTAWHEDKGGWSRDAPDLGVELKLLSSAIEVQVKEVIYFKVEIMNRSDETIAIYRPELMIDLIIANKDSDGFGTRGHKPLVHNIIEASDVDLRRLVEITPGGKHVVSGKMGVKTLAMSFDEPDRITLFAQISGIGIKEGSDQDEVLGRVWGGGVRSGLVWIKIRQIVTKGPFVNSHRLLPNLKPDSFALPSVSLINKKWTIESIRGRVVYQIRVKHADKTYVLDKLWVSKIPVVLNSNWLAIVKIAENRMDQLGIYDLKQKTFLHLKTPSDIRGLASLEVSPSARHVAYFEYDKKGHIRHVVRTFPNLDLVKKGKWIKVTVGDMSRGVAKWIDSQNIDIFIHIAPDDREIAYRVKVSK